MALLTYSVLMAVWVQGEAARHTCTGIEIEIKGQPKAEQITRRGITDKLLHYPAKIIGAPVNTINTMAIADYLKGLSNFETVECLITSGRKLRVEVVPMVPEIRVFDSTGSYYLNKDGKRIPSNAAFFVDVPVVTGAFDKRFTARDVLPVVRYVAADSLLTRLVGMIKADGPDNILLIPRIRGHVINFGDTTRLDEKRTALLTAYRSVLPYRGWETYDTISVKFRGQIVATRRDKTPLYGSAVADDDIDPEEATLEAPLGAREQPRQESTPATQTGNTPQLQSQTHQ